MFQVPWSDYAPALLDGLERTVAYTVASFAGAVVLGLVLALRIFSYFFMKLLSPALFHEELKSESAKRIMMRRIEDFQSESFGYRGQRLAHGMASVMDSLIGMTGSANISSDVWYVRTNVQKGAVKTEARIIHRPGHFFPKPRMPGGPNQQRDQQHCQQDQRMPASESPITDHIFLNRG